MTVGELQELLDKMVLEHPEYANLDVCNRTMDSYKFYDIYPGEICILRNAYNGYKFLCVGDSPDPSEEPNLSIVWSLSRN